MPRKSRRELPPLALGTGEESPGRRLARLRKQRGLTQVQLAERVGIIQVLVSDYERGRLKLSAEMAVRLALALEVTTDELLGMRAVAEGATTRSRKVLRRLEQIERLSKRDQEALLRTIDAFLTKGQAEASKGGRESVRS